MEGVNLSGDLSNPARDIPKGTRASLLLFGYSPNLSSGRFSPGTLRAIGISYTIYILQVFFMAGAFDRDLLKTDQNIYQYACLGSKYIVVAGEQIILLFVDVFKTYHSTV